MKHIRHRKRLFIIITVVAIMVLGASAYAWQRMRSNNPSPDHISTNDSGQKTEDKAETEKDAPEQSPTPTPSAPKPQQPAAFNKSQYSLNDPTSVWVVANKMRPLQPKTYAPGDLVGVGGGQQMRREAADALSRLRQGAGAAGLRINPLSGYRSYNTQAATYQGWVNQLGQAQADRESARPGHSEHQTGLAIDVGSGTCDIEQCFGATKDGQWLAAHAHEYGFVIRYHEGKEHITGYVYEPWHIRFVGVALATELRAKNVQTLEEFFGLPAAPNY